MYLPLGNSLLKIQEWETKPEMFYFLQKCDLGFIELEGRQSSQISYYTISCHTQNNHWGIGISSSSILMLNLLLDYKRENLIIGLDNGIYFIDIRLKKIIKHINLDHDFFFQFSTLSNFENLFIVQTELSIFLIDFMGKIHWLYNAKDVITDVSIDKEEIQVKTLENQTLVLDLNTGNPINLDSAS